MTLPTIPETHSTDAPAQSFTPATVDQFHENGYTIARQLIGQEMRDRMLRAARDGLERNIEPIEYEADMDYPGSPASRWDTGGRTARRLKQAHARDPVFTEWIMMPELVGRLKQLLGPSVVMPLVHHNCVMTKQPCYSSDTGWHQDIRYWSFERPELVSAWLALGNEHAENGCLQLISGSHRRAFDGRCFDERLFFRPDPPENQKLIDTRIHAELEPGDVLFFHCRTLHSASRNRTDQPKVSVVATFRPGSNRPIPGTRSASLPEMLVTGSTEPD